MTAMPNPADLLERTRDRIVELCSEFDVPGIAVGLRIAGKEAVVAHGVASVVSGVEATPDTLFQVGSISKVFTASVAMRLADRGLLDLDAPVRTYLPALRLSDVDVASRLSVRHLLNHTSGLEGDIFDDTGRGDDCITRYVELLADIPQARPLGEGFSYCNAGWVLLGAVLEAVGGGTWDTVLRDEVLRPLGLASTCTLPEEALARRVAFGHHPGPDGAMVPTPVWTYPRAIGPAGLVIADASDLLAFAAAHLAEGRGPEGPWLSPSVARLMREREVAVPGQWPAPEWGLGWIRYDWDGVAAIGHDGGTLGHRAQLRLVPERDVAIVVLTNATTGALVARRLTTELMAHVGIVVPDLPTAPSRPLAPGTISRHAGTYGRRGERWDVAWRQDRLVADVVIDATDLVPPVRAMFDLEPVDELRFLVRNRGEADMVVTFAPDSSWMFNGRHNARQAAALNG